VSSSGAAALGHAIKAAELYMQAAEAATNSAERNRLRRKCQNLIASAEKLKAAGQDAGPPRSSRDLPPGEEVILLRSSELHGNKFPPWRVNPASSAFALQPGSALYMLAPHALRYPGHAAFADRQAVIPHHLRCLLVSGRTCPAGSAPASYSHPMMPSCVKTHEATLSKTLPPTAPWSPACAQP